MRRTLRVGLSQWHATSDVEANLATALQAVAEAAGAGAELVLLPENGLMLAGNVAMRERAFREDSPELGKMGAAAAEHGVAVVLGGAKLATDEGIVNAALVWDANGELAGRYDKIHLFDAHIDGQSFEASSVERAGRTPVLLDIDGVSVGLTICYDVRFPELYRTLAQAGAAVVLVPAAFTHTTGSAHWHTLLRARAIENACYVVASATVRGADESERAADAFETFGHALAVGPWGEILADLGDAAYAVQVVELDLATVPQVRDKLPVLRQGNPAAYATAPASIDVNGMRRTDG
ncbi:carbon-nitrogen hydrolase family protein [Nocardioides sp. AN3]